jgi:hypothetical protein
LGDPAVRAKVSAFQARQAGKIMTDDQSLQ